MNNKELIESIKRITDIKNSQELIDLAFKRARTKKGEAKIVTVHDLLIDRLSRIVKTFPSINELPPFYREILDKRIGLINLKKALGKINGAIKAIRIIRKRSRDMKQFYGRISNLIKDLDNELMLLRKAKKELTMLPIINPELFTVAFTGLPNVGKTTILNILAKTRAEIADYAFTTKHINIGIYKEGLTFIQLMDTPGVLGRPKKNSIEEEAVIAMKYAHLIIFVFDPLQDKEYQLKLLKQTKKINKNVYIYISKTDLIEKKQLLELNKELGEAITSIEELKEFLIRKAREFYKN